jgi:hypothetical protein
MTVQTQRRVTKFILPGLFCGKRDHSVKLLLGVQMSADPQQLYDSRWV